MIHQICMRSIFTLTKPHSVMASCSHTLMVGRRTIMISTNNSSLLGSFFQYERCTNNKPYLIISSANKQYQSQSLTVRCFSSAKKKEKMKAFKLKQEQYRQENLAAQEAPDFASMMRQLYRKSHPDLLRHSHPELAEINDQSMQVLNGILSTVKTNEYPPRIVKDITFYIKAGTDNEYKPYLLSIRTGGGDCKGHLTETFGAFFVQTGLSTSGKFIWNKEYFPMEVDTSYHSSFQI